MKKQNTIINLTKTLSHLPENNIRELETITHRIVDTGKAEIVVLFGSYARGNYKAQRGKNRGKKSDYDILAVASEFEAQKELNSELRGAFEDIPVNVQLIVERIGFVNSNLEERQYFFTDIKREGIILHDSGKFKLSDPVDLTPTRRREIAEEDFKSWFKQAQEMYDYYSLGRRKKYFGSASFHLQQVVEMCYTAIEMVFTHYNPYEHNLETLQKRVSPFDSRIKEVLPYKTKQQQELFDRLNFAYIGGRYRSEEEFPVTREHLDYWSKEARRLLALTEIVCKERIECLREVEDKSR